MSSWYRQVRSENNDILEAIKEHPFITQLINGSLDYDVFLYYINQDVIYLSEYKKVLALIGTKCRTSEDEQFFLDSETGIIHLESTLHKGFIKEQKFTKEASPTCELYTSYLTKIILNGSLEESLSVVLPCFTIYKEIGDYILKSQKNKLKNPYQDWINTYGGEAFAKSVQHAIDITNKYAKVASPDILELMDSAFRKASKLEWMFWDSAFSKENWKI